MQRLSRASCDSVLGGKMTGLNLGRLLFCACALATLVTSANAKNLLNARYGAAQVFTTTALVKIGTGSVGGPYIESFTAPKAETVMISFSAVCSTSGTTDQYTTVRILVDGLYIYPSNQQDDAFCSTAGATTATAGLDTHTVVTALSVTAGIHGIQVKVTPQNGGTSRIDNLSLLAWD